MEEEEQQQQMPEVGQKRHFDQTSSADAASVALKTETDVLEDDGDEESPELVERNRKKARLSRYHDDEAEVSPDLFSPPVIIITTSHPVLF